eukprot:TRINITY_DN12705_c0_g4_i2.p1 TRINITY_DN12705_c0_g4~~TRINITY_DN12705_c0_g4_i2.p1  ORF type:complete len:740 (-),score=162.38 TRINITY_DN12705_c0_g4_i2:21-2240(-)
MASTGAPRAGDAELKAPEAAKRRKQHVKSAGSTPRVPRLPLDKGLAGVPTDEYSWRDQVVCDLRDELRAEFEEMVAANDAEWQRQHADLQIIRSTVSEFLENCGREVEKLRADMASIIDRATEQAREHVRVEEEVKELRDTMSQSLANLELRLGAAKAQVEDASPCATGLLGEASPEKVTEASPKAAIEEQEETPAEGAKSPSIDDVADNLLLSSPRSFSSAEQGARLRREAPLPRRPLPPSQPTASAPSSAPRPPLAPPPKGHRCISFRVHCSHTRPGLHVRIVGSCEAFGAWKPKRGVVLETCEKRYPYWVGDVVLEEDQLVEYKYIVCGPNGGNPEWEGHQNRTLHLKEALRSGACPDIDYIVIAERYNKQPDMISRFKSLYTFSSVVDTVDVGSETNDGGCMIAATLRQNSSPPAFGSLSCGLVREGSCLDCYTPTRGGGAELGGPGFGDAYDLIGNGPLGEGTFGLVWRCLPSEPLGGGDSTRRPERAAKIIRKDRLRVAAKSVKTGLFEIQMHVALQHRNIVRLIEYFDDPTALTLVMEYCAGGDLFDTILDEYKYWNDNAAMRERDAAHVTRHVLIATKYLHELSIAHRDLKCENVVLLHRDVLIQENTFKVCDFGFAAKETGNGFSDRVGSPDTVAPELLGTRCHYGLPADVWSIGCMVYMMLSGSPPFRGETDEDVMRQVRAGSYCLSGNFWDSISEDAKHVIRSLMAVSPHMRATADDTLEMPWLREDK